MIKFIFQNITDIIDNRETLVEKSSVINYDQNSYATTSSNTSITPVTASNVQSNDWILSERVNRANRVQRAILPKPVAVNNSKEGRQGPILDVKLIIADHRSKNPETAVPKRGRRKATLNDFSVPTSSAPLRYPNPMGFGNPIHHVNDGNFKTSKLIIYFHNFISCEVIEQLYVLFSCYKFPWSSKHGTWVRT